MERFSKHIFVVISLTAAASCVKKARGTESCLFSESQLQIPDRENYGCTKT